MILSIKDNFDSFVKGLIPSLVCILIVFVVLILIMGIVMLLNLIKGKQVNEEPIKEESKTVNNQYIKLEDITDEDMMVAALVASIDYQNEVKTDVRLKNIKRVG